jgi:NAD(P)-dependent dehydrogenase (short-subunit alcohol dehydrogenase family)
VSDEGWFRGFDRLFMSVVWTIRAVHSYLASSPHGTIVTVTNPVLRALGEEFPVANSFGRGIQGLARTQARAFAPAVRVNAVLPGPHETNDLELFLTELVDRGVYDDLDAARAAVLSESPFESPGDPLALGKLVAFLSSEHASFVNGAAIPVDGGSWA